MSEAQTAGLVMVGAALLLGAIASFFYRRTRKFLAGAVATTGTVLELVARPSSDGTVYAPRVEFSARDGQTREFESSVGRNPPGHEVGDSVKVLYDPDDPGKARIDSWFGLWFVSTLLGGLAGLFGLVGLLVALLGG